MDKKFISRENLHHVDLAEPIRLLLALSCAGAVLRRKKKREKGEKDRQRDSGKKGRPAADEGEGGETGGKEKRGKGVHSRPAHASIDEDVVTSEHTRRRRSKKRSPRPRPTPQGERRDDEKEESRKGSTRDRDRTAQTEQQRNKPKKHCKQTPNKRQTDKKTKHRKAAKFFPRAESRDTSNEIKKPDKNNKNLNSQISTAKREQKQGAPEIPKKNSTRNRPTRQLKRHPKKNPKIPISGYGTKMELTPAKRTGSAKKTSFPGEKTRNPEEKTKQNSSKNKEVSSKKYRPPLSPLFVGNGRGSPSKTMREKNGQRFPP